MKKLAMILCCVPFVAVAQTIPSIEDMRTQYLLETGQLRMTLGQTIADKVATLRKLDECLAKIKPEEKSEDKK